MWEWLLGLQSGDEVRQLSGRRTRPFDRPRAGAHPPRRLEGPGAVIMAFGYRYALERQENGWWLVRFPGIPEALTEGETEEEARLCALDCLIAALEGYTKAGRPLPRARN